MKRAVLSLIVFLSLGCMCSTCVSCEPDGPTYYMDQEFKDYIVYPQGSYWVYEEMSSGQIDTVKIYSSEIKIHNGQTILGFNYEEYLVLMKSSFNNDTISGVGGIDFTDKNFSEYEEGSTNIHKILNRSLLFFSKKPVGYELNYTEVDLVDYLEFLELYTVFSLEYEDVKVFEHKINYYSEQPKRVYFAKGVGIIKKELFNGEIWQLKKYFIKK